MGAKSASFRYRRSGTGWCKARSTPGRPPWRAFRGAVFEADFQPGSFGYRPKRTAHDAIKRVAEAIVQRKTRVLDIDLRAYFDNVRHDRLLEKVAQRVDDADIRHLLKVMLKASGKKGVPQGGVISALLSNIYPQ